MRQSVWDIAMLLFDDNFDRLWIKGTVMYNKINLVHHTIPFDFVRVRPRFEVKKVKTCKRG